jgi:hypothetical protein
VTDDDDDDEEEDPDEEKTKFSFHQSSLNDVG